MSGAPSQIDLFDYKPQAATSCHGKDLPDSVRMGQRLTGMTSRPDAASRASPSMFKFAQHGQCGAWVSELLPHTAKIVDDLCHRQVAAHRGDQPRPGHHLHPDRQPAARPAEHRRLAQLRPGQREPRTCRRSSCMISQGSGNQTRPAAVLRACGAAASCRRKHQGVALPLERRPGAVPVEPAGRRRRRPAGAMLDAPGRAQPAAAATSSAIRRSHTRIAQYEMAFRMQTSVPELTDLSQRAAARSSTCTAPTRNGPARSPPTACWPGGWPSAACASSSSSTAAGTSTATCRRRSAGQCQRRRPAVGRPDHRPEAARPARRHAGHLGRRVRPHRLLPGHADHGQLRPRPSPALLHHLAGRRRHQAGHRLRRDRRLLLQHRRATRVHVHDLQRHDPALPGHRPHAADLPLPGPRLPPDRRAREGGEGAAGVTSDRRRA